VATALDHRAAHRVTGFAETVFATYTRLALETGAVNLGQGFPDDPPDALVQRALRDAVAGPQQYAPLPGVPALNEAVAESVGGRLGRSLDPVREVQVTVGATEGLFATLQALVDPGDDVVLVAPWYDAYPAMVGMAGGRVVGVAMAEDAGAWRLDRAALADAVTPRTKAIVITTPHNPSGAVMDAADLDAVVAAAERVDAVVVSDEVYEHLSFVPFTPAASRPGAWERTLTVSSVGKSYAVTGWKVGWVTGPAALIAAVRAAHQWIPFAVATPLQHAVASVLHADLLAGGARLDEQRARYRTRRDALHEGLAAAGFGVSRADGGYFLVADARPLGEADADALALRLPREAGVVAIPMTPFTDDATRHVGEGRLRFAFCKSDAAIAEACRRLRTWRG
jgi:N-succinyldiaminopimelate aminotransferase